MVTAPGYLSTTGSVEIRAPADGDRTRIAAMWERCSLATRTGRFHAPVRHLPVSYLEAVLGDPDASTVAAVPSTDLLIGIASLFRAGTSRSAELGVLVEDAWQLRGIGRRLVSRLVLRAPSRGITVLTASVLACNESVTRPLRQITGAYSATITGPILEVTIALHSPVPDDADSA
jgi:GNAT superfamily N-acetyltransferase